MQIIIKGRQKIVLPQDLKEYINSKISKVTSDLKEPTVCEVTLLDTNGPRGGIDKIVRISCSVADIKNPVFVETINKDFFKSVDLAQSKLARALHKAKR